MSILDDLKMYGRFAWGLYGFLHQKISLEDARAIVQRRMAEREANFLRLVERGIFGYPRSPYLPLLKMAGCGLGDIRQMVKDTGLEGTLLALRKRGVYVSFEEFKGREQIVRNGQVIPINARDFDNPYLQHYYAAESGGTTGAGTRIPIDLDHLAAQAPHLMLAFDTHRVLAAPSAIWYAILPNGSGINNLLRPAPFRNIPRKWFTPVTSQDLRPSLKSRLATRYIVLAGRLSGAPIPWPEPVSMDQAIVVAHWMAETLRIHGACLVRTMLSFVLRVCLAAREAGVDLTGATFIAGGEPPTPAKVNEITRTGARWVPIYPFSEAGHIGIGCAQPVDENDIHLYKDFVALIQHPRQVPGSEITVDAFHFTTLLPTTPKVMLNVESDDYGVIETRHCGCPLEKLGFTDHVRHIRSFRKLTGEGVTLVGSEMVRILEEVLPARFGGTSLDYQLMEEEDAQGFTRLSLVVSPKIELTDEQEVIRVVLEALGRGSVSADIARAIWSQAKTLQLKRIEPILTVRGKLMPLHLAHRVDQRADSQTHS